MFLCKVCRPSEVENVGGQTNSEPESIFKCLWCKSQSNFKYNLKRHIETLHDGVEEDPPIEEDATESHIETPEPSIVHPKVNTIEDFLKGIGLENHTEKFITEGVDLNMLFSFETKEELVYCLKEVGIKRFGDRYKIEEGIKAEKRALQSDKNRGEKLKCSSNSIRRSENNDDMNQGEGNSELIQTLITHDYVKTKASTMYLNDEDNTLNIADVSSIPNYPMETNKKEETCLFMPPVNTTSL